MTDRPNSWKVAWNFELLEKLLKLFNKSKFGEAPACRSKGGRWEGRSLYERRDLANCHILMGSPESGPLLESDRVAWKVPIYSLSTSKGINNYLGLSAHKSAMHWWAGTTSEYRESLSLSCLSQSESPKRHPWLSKLSQHGIYLSVSEQTFQHKKKKNPRAK